MMLTSRSQGRPGEVTGMRCGYTNVLNVHGSRPDMHPTADPTTESQSRVRVRHKTSKSNSMQGDGSTLPEEVGRVLVLFLALVKSAQV